MSRSISMAFGSVAKAHRSPRYVALGLSALFLLVLLIVIVYGQTVPGPVETALFEAINQLSDWWAYILYPLGQYGSLVAVPVSALLLALVFTRKIRPAIYVLIGGVAAWLASLLIKDWIGRGRPGDILGDVIIRGPESFIGYGFPSGHAAVSAALTTVIWPYVSPLTRRLLVVLTGVVMFSRVYMGAHFPLDVIAGAALGVMVGSLVVLIFGVPFREVNIKRVKYALAQRGIKLHEIKPASVDARGSVPYFAKSSEGDLFVKFYGKEQFSADWLFRMIRFVKYKNLEDEAPYLGLKRNLEHEALMTMLAKFVGVRTPKVVGFFRVDDYYWGLAQELIPGKSLDSLKPEKINDKLLAGIWKQISILHENHLAHRDLRAANVFVDKHGEPLLIDFGFAESMANIRRMKMDVSELLASLATIIGPQKAVASCRTTLGDEVLIEAYPFLQYEAFSGETRTRMKKRKPLLDELRDEVANVVGKAKVEGKKIQLQRISTASLIQIAALGLSMFVLVPQFSVFRDSFSILVNINLWWIPLLFALTALTFIAASFTLKVFSLYPMKYVDSLIVQLSTSFTNKLLPSGVGGLAIIIQFLRTRGHKVAEAAPVLTMARIMDFIGFIVPMLIILLLFYQDLGDIFATDTSPGIIFAVMAVVVLIVGTLMSIKKIRNKVKRFIKQMLDTFVKLATDPIVLSKAFVSSLVMNLAFLSAFFVSLHAVGLEISYVEALVVFAIAVLAGSAAPTPGGIGVIEAAMVAVLIALGYDNNLSLAGVLLYRFFTYWLPIPFGFISYRYTINRRLI